MHTEPDAINTMVSEDASPESIAQVGYSGMTGKSKGSNPEFGGDTIEFLNIEGVVSELVFLSFRVMDDSFG